MRNNVGRIALIPIVCLLVFANSCVFDETASQVVITERINVIFNEYHEAPNFTSAVVCDRFKERFWNALDENNVDVDDIVSVGVVGAGYKTVGKFHHDWTMTAEVYVQRQDDKTMPPTAGPALLVEETTHSLESLKGKPTYAMLDAAGVAIIDAALEDLIDGQDPRLVLVLQGLDVDPTPTAMDPMVFKWQARVEFQIVVEKELKGKK